MKLLLFHVKNYIRLSHETFETKYGETLVNKILIKIVSTQKVDFIKRYIVNFSILLTITQKFVAEKNRLVRQLQSSLEPDQLLI